MSKGPGKGLFEESHHPLDLNDRVLGSEADLLGNLTLSGDLAPSEVDVTFSSVATGIGLYVLSFMTFVGNAMVLHAIRTEKRLQTVRTITKLFRYFCSTFHTLKNVI